MSDVLPDYLRNDLRVVICGTAVATASRNRGGYYAGPGNEFWKYLYRSGLTRERLSPESDERVLEYGVGLTDLVKDRASSTDGGLDGFDVAAFIRKVERYQPRWVAFHGKTAARVVSRARGLGQAVNLGPQTWTIGSRPVFVLPSASGSNRDPARLEGKASRLDWYQALARTLNRDEREVSGD